MLVALSLMTFLGCEQDGEGTTTHTFNVDVYEQTSATSTKRLASPTLVYLFKDNGKEVDKKKSCNSVESSKNITYTDGTTAKYDYVSSSINGINKFESIPNGSYTIWVWNKTDTWLVNYYSSRNILLDKKFKTQTFEKIFHKSDFSYGYEEWNEAW